MCHCHPLLQDHRARVGLGLINVNPVIDKQIDGIYDLDAVDVQRYSFEEGTMARAQPLLNAVRSQPVLDPNHGAAEQQATEDVNNASSVTFQDKLAHTNALLKAQKTQGHGSTIPPSSSYFTKQVNFFKSAGGKSFVQDRTRTT